MLVGRLALGLTFGLGFAVALPTGPAAAEAPSTVAAETVDDGVYVARTRAGEVTESALIAAVDQARFESIRLVVVLPSDPQPTARAFARRVQEQTEADAVMVFPSEGDVETYVSEELSRSESAARTLARAEADPSDAVTVFATGLTATIERPTPPIVGRVLTWLVVCIVVVAAVAAIESWVKRNQGGGVDQARHRSMV